MCRCYYLGTEHHVPTDEIGLKPFTKFHVLRLDKVGLKKTQIKILSLFSHVVYLGSHEGCGCGFESGDEDFKALSVYLKKLPPQKMAIYSCWSGDEALPADHFWICSISEIESAEFNIQERGLIALSQ